MADIELVIKIPEEEYKCVQITGHIGNSTQVSNAILTGTPIPTGHGNLVDVDELLSNEKPVGISDVLWKESHTYKMLANAQIIIEADKVESKVKKKGIKEH